MLQRFPALTELTLECNDIRPAALLPFVSACAPNLQLRMRISYGQLSAHTQLAPWLTHVTIDDTTRFSSSAELPCLTALTALTSFDVSAHAHPVEWLEHPNLRSLSLRGVTRCEFNTLFRANFPRLTELTLDCMGNHTTLASSLLASMPHLAHLARIYVPEWLYDAPSVAEFRRRGMCNLCCAATGP